jgi:prophage regulatory protein
MRALTITDVTSKIGGGRTFVYRAMQEGSFPKPIRVGRRSSWLDHEVEAWMADRIAERDSGVTANDKITLRARKLQDARKAKAAAR